MSGVIDFKGDCGECSNSGSYFSASSSVGMAPDQSATVNGGDPSKCVIANDGGKVFAIEVQSIAGIYDYQVRVQAQGPSGAFSGSMYLAFRDMSNDVYYLSIYSSSKSWHEVSYNSSSPAIQTIYWSDYSFTVKDNDVKADKPNYKIHSPAEMEPA